MRPSVMLALCGTLWAIAILIAWTWLTVTGHPVEASNVQHFGFLSIIDGVFAIIVWLDEEENK